MAATSIDGAKLKQAIEEFGSLEKAVEKLKYEVDILSKQKNKQKQETEESSLFKKKLTADIGDLSNQFNNDKTRLQLLADNVGKWERQYNLFQGFMAMLVGSPSIDSSLKNLVALLQELDVSGWTVTKKADDLRSHFVRTIMGDYLKCFRCDACGAKFMADRQPRYKSIGSNYLCPSCHSSQVEADDSFLKAMVSEGQSDNIVIARKTLEENEALRPLKAFWDVPCEICGKPITEWTKDNVSVAVDGCGWAHEKCWKTDLGNIRLAVRLANMIQKKLENR